MPTGIIDHAKLEAAKKGFKTVFDMALQQATLMDPSIVATTIQSDSAEEVYNWLGAQPKMRQWIGDRKFDELRAYDWTVRNVDYEVSLAVRANDIRDDKLSIVTPRIQALGREAAYHKDELLVNLLISGFTTACYDGQYFFDTDHVDGNGSSQSNKGTSALDATTFNSAIEAMMKITDEQGRPMRVRPTHLIVGPKLRATAMSIVEAEVLASGASNTNFQAVQLIVHPLLVGSADDYWYLIDASAPVRPLILQEREPVEFIAQDDPASEPYFNRKEFRYGANWRGAAAYGLWQFAWGAEVS